MDTAMHDMGSLGLTLQVDLPPGRILPCTGMCGGGWTAGAELRAVFYFKFSFPFCVCGWGSFACSSPIGGILFGVSGLL